MASNKRLSFLLIAFITLIGVVFARTSSFYVVSASEKKSSSGLLVGESKYMPMRGVITDVKTQLGLLWADRLRQGAAIPG